MGLADPTHPATTPKENNASERETLTGFARTARELFEKGHYNEALKNALVADQILQNGSLPDLSLRAMSQYFIAEICLKMGHPLDAENYARNSLKIYESLSEHKPEILFRALEFLVQSLRAQGKHAEVIDLVNRIAPLPSDLLADYSLESAAILFEGEQSSIALTDYPLAIRLTHKSIQIERDALTRSRESEEIKRKRQLIFLHSEFSLGRLYYNCQEYLC